MTLVDALSDPTSNLSASFNPNEVNVVLIDISFALSSLVTELEEENAKKYEPLMKIFKEAMDKKTVMPTHVERKQVREERKAEHYTPKVLPRKAFVPTEKPTPTLDQLRYKIRSG